MSKGQKNKNKLNKRGPKTEPCGTPVVKFYLGIGSTTEEHLLRSCSEETLPVGGQPSTVIKAILEIYSLMKN